MPKFTLVDVVAQKKKEKRPFSFFLACARKRKKKKKERMAQEHGRARFPPMWPRERREKRRGVKTVAIFSFGEVDENRVGEKKKKKELLVKRSSQSLYRKKKKEGKEVQPILSDSGGQGKKEITLPQYYPDPKVLERGKGRSVPTSAKFSLSALRSYSPRRRDLSYFIFP